MLTQERENLVVDNLGLVRNVANKFSWHGDFDDIVSEGNLGLCWAAEHWDESKGVKFSTYATTCIHGYIAHFVREYGNGPIRPYHMRKDGKDEYLYAKLFYLDTPTDSDRRYDDGTWYDQIPSREDARMHAIMELAEIKENLSTRYNDRDVNIFFLHVCGFSSREIANAYGVSRHRVNQIINAIRKYVKTMYYGITPCAWCKPTPLGRQ